MNRQFYEIAAFDVDDVLLEQARGFCRASNRAFGTSLQIAEYRDNWGEAWGITAEEAEARRQEMIRCGFFESLEPVEGAVQALQELSALGIGLVAITKRRESLREVTEASLSKHFDGLFSGLYLATYFRRDGQKITRNKSELCVLAGASSLTDDQYATCLEVAGVGIKALHFGDYGWSEPEEVHPNIVRARTWDDVIGVFDGRS